MAPILTMTNLLVDSTDEAHCRCDPTLVKVGRAMLAAHGDVCNRRHFGGLFIVVLLVVNLGGNATLQIR